MNVDDATREVIDTSDTEERELLEAQVPGYHRKVWGKSSHTGMEIDDENNLTLLPIFARLEPRTPSHKRIISSSDSDPSPVFSRLWISPMKSQEPASTTVTPATTPVGLMSTSGSTHASDSTISFSSPLRSLNVGPLQIRSNSTLEGPFVEGLCVNNVSQDSLALSGPLSPKANIVAPRPNGPNNVKENIYKPTLTLIYNETSSDKATSHKNYHVLPSISPRSSPPLEFPFSPSPDPLSISSAVSPDRSGSGDSDVKRSISFAGTHSGFQGESGANSIGAANTLDFAIGPPIGNTYDIGGFDDLEAGPSHNTDPLSLSPLTPSSISLAREGFSLTESGRTKSKKSFRFRSLSLTPPPLAGPSSSRISPPPPSSLTPPPIADPFPAPPSSSILIPPDLDPPPRQYAMRTRSAMQLRPFEVERRLYKKQLRGMPEAIVKNTTAAVGRKPQERYLEGEDWGGQVDDEDRDEDGVWESNERRKEKKRQKQVAEELMRKLGIAHSSEEDEEEEEVLREVEGLEDGNNEKRGKKRKRRFKTHEFPMVEDTQAPSSIPTSHDNTVEPSSRPRPRPRPAFTGRSPMPGSSKSQRTSPAHLPPEPMEVEQNHGFDPEDAGPIGFGSPIQELGGRSSSIVINDEQADLEPGRESNRDRESEESDVQMVEDTNAGDDLRNDHQSSSEAESSEVMMTTKARKQLKAMKRMMPAALMQKLLTSGQGTSKKRKSRTYQSEDSDDGKDDAPLQPGRGRKRIVSPSSRDPKRYEIKGDPESESESEGGPLPDQDVIELEDTDDNGSDHADGSLGESEEDLHDGDIQTWLAPEQDYDHTLPSAPRTRRPDHERDRPRGGDLIDRMLQRTNRVGPRDPKSAKHKDKSKVKGPRHPNSRPVLDITTRDARRHGAGGGRQTKLAFPKINKPRTSGSAIPDGPSLHQYQEHHVEPRAAGKEKKRSKKHTRGAAQGAFAVINGNGRKITSGRRREIIHIESDDDAFHDALAPAGPDAPERARPRPDNDRERRKNMKDIVDKFRAAGTAEEPDAFDPHPNGGQKHSHVTLDFDIPLLPPAMTFGTESYMGKGKLAELISVLKDEIESPRPPAVTTFDQHIDPDLPVSQFSTLLAATCDHLYDASTIALDDPEMPLKMKASEDAIYTICRLVSFRAWCAADDKDGHIAAAVSEQAVHLVGRITDRLEVVSADGHILDYRSFALYWFVIELELRIAFARRKRKEAEEDPMVMSTAVAQRYAILLFRRLLEYGLERTLQPLHRDAEPLDITSPDVHTMEFWACLLHLAPFLCESEPSGSTSSPFWRIVEASMEQQSNKPDSSLDTSERLWMTMFSLCTICQFSVHGLAMSTIRLEQNWPMVTKALGSIRLGANDELDHSKPASTLKKRDKYLRLVTARCLLLDVRFRWHLQDADLVFRELCAIFRSRKFSNLLGETSDFPIFIRERDYFLFHGDMDNDDERDTAYGVFLKMIVRAFKDFATLDRASRTRKLKLLAMAVPVNSMSFRKTSPPIGQELSMLYNRYSAIVVAVYVEPTTANIHSRLQQVRRYITFKDADRDSQMASIRTMMNLAILLRHLSLPLDDVLAWASEMMNDLLANYIAAEQDPKISQIEKDQQVLSIQLLLGSVRMVIENPTLNRSPPRPPKYPDVALLREDWIYNILTSSLYNNHRTGIEIRKYIQSFLTARAKVIAPPPIPRPSVDRLESQDEYGDAGLDMDDPAVLELLDSLEDQPNENYATDTKAGPIMGDIATKRMYSLVCRHFAQDFDSRFPGSYFVEGDQWIECWLGCASVAVRNKARDWNFYITMARAACEGIKNRPTCRRRVYMRFMLTMLQLDPTSYSSNEDKFLEVWFESIVSPEITVEHEFSARLFSVGALRHVFFQNIPCDMDLTTGIVAFEKPDFENRRLSFIDVVVGNVAGNIGRAASTQTELYISFVEKMLTTLLKSSQSMGGEARAEYTEFSTLVHASVKKHPRLMEARTLHAVLSQNNS